MRTTRTLLPLLLSLFAMLPAFAAAPPCTPCAGVVVHDPVVVLDGLLAESGLEAERHYSISDLRSKRGPCY